MKIAQKEVKAVIFDMDGTLIDSTTMWSKIDEDFFATHGMEVPPDYSEKIAHLGLKQAASITKRDYNIKDSEEQILKSWQDASYTMYLNNIPLKPYAVEILSYLKNNNIKIALATANKKINYIPCLKRLNILDYFDFIADVDDVGQGKESCKLYDCVSKTLNIDKKYCVVVEDIATGLKTAFLNGYISVGIDDIKSKSQEDEKRKYSHFYVNDLNELLNLLK